MDSELWYHIIYIFGSDQLLNLDHEMRQAIGHVSAATTRCNLFIQQNLYLDLCTYFKLQVLPGSTSTIHLFAQFLAQKFNNAGTMKNYMYRTRVLNSLNCFNPNSFDHQSINILLKGLAKDK